MWDPLKVLALLSASVSAAAISSSLFCDPSYNGAVGAPLPTVWAKVQIHCNDPQIHNDLSVYDIENTTAQLTLFWFETGSDTSSACQTAFDTLIPACEFLIVSHFIHSDE